MLKGASGTMEFCTAQSRSMSEVIHFYNGFSERDVKLGRLIQSSVFGTFTLFIAVEFCIYVTLYKDITNHDKTMKGKLSNDVLKR